MPDFDCTRVPSVSRIIFTVSESTRVCSRPSVSRNIFTARRRMSVGRQAERLVCNFSRTGAQSGTSQ
eukprot:7105395-Prymnesium_polylepis.1